MKNVNFHQILRPLLPECYFGLQDGLKNALRSAQDGSKRFLKSNFFALENRLKFERVLRPILVDLGVPKPPSITGCYGRIWLRTLMFLACNFCVVLDRLWDGPRGAQEASTPPQERPKRLQEAAKSAPGDSKRA